MPVYEKIDCSHHVHHIADPPADPVHGWRKHRIGSPRESLDRYRHGRRLWESLCRNRRRQGDRVCSRLPKKKVKMLQNGTWTDITGSENFLHPVGIATDSKGNVYVVDDTAEKIRKFSNGSWSDLDEWEAGVFPIAMTVDSNDNLVVAYIADWDIGLGGVKRQQNGSWEDITGNVEFIIPNSIAVDQNGDIYVASDLYTVSNQLMKWSDGAWSNVATGGYCPANVAVDSNNDVYIYAICNGCRLQRI